MVSFSFNLLLLRNISLLFIIVLWRSCVGMLTALHTTLNELHLDKNHSDHRDPDRCLYAYCAQNTNTYGLALEASPCHTVLISQHCNFMLVNFVYFRISLF